MLFNRKAVLIEHQELTVGEFNIDIDGAYDNDGSCKTTPLR